MNIRYLMLFFLIVGPYARGIMEKEDKGKKYLLIKLVDKNESTKDGVDYRSQQVDKSCNNRKDWDGCLGCFSKGWERKCVHGKGYCKRGLCTGWLILEGAIKHYTPFLFSFFSDIEFAVGGSGWFHIKSNCGLC